MSVARPIAGVGVGVVLAAGCLSKPEFECEITPGPERTEVLMGTMGGVPSGDLDCGDRSIVGVGFTLTRTPNGTYDEKTAVKVSLRCATVSNHGRGYATGATGDTMPIGGSATIDGPFFADCPDARVVVGLAAHHVAPNSLFNSLAIDCASLDPSGAPTGDVVRIPVAGTGTRPTDLDAPCNAGQALHGLKSMSGSELDRLELTCAPTTCQPPP